MVIENGKKYYYFLNRMRFNEENQEVRNQLITIY